MKVDTNVFLFVYALIFISMLSCVNSIESDEIEHDSSESLELNSDNLIKYVNGMDSHKFDLDQLDIDDSAPDNSGQNDFAPNTFGSNSHYGIGEISFGSNGFQRNVFGRNEYGQNSYVQDRNEFGAGDFVRGLFGIQRAQAAGFFSDNNHDGGANDGREVLRSMYRSKVKPGDTVKRLINRFPELKLAFKIFREDYKKLCKKEELCKKLTGKAKLACEATVVYGTGRATLKVVARLKRAFWSKDDIIDLFQVSFGLNGFRIAEILDEIRPWHL